MRQISFTFSAHNPWVKNDMGHVMKLNYDIDILPPSRRCVSVGQDAPAQVYHAAFRDPQTAQAARNASTRTLAILNEAGTLPSPIQRVRPWATTHAATAGIRNT